MPRPYLQRVGQIPFLYWFYHPTKIVASSYVLKKFNLPNSSSRTMANLLKHLFMCTFYLIRSLFSYGKRRQIAVTRFEIFMNIAVQWSYEKSLQRFSLVASGDTVFSRLIEIA